MDKISKGKSSKKMSKTTKMNERKSKRSNLTGTVSEGNLGAKLPK